MALAPSRVMARRAFDGDLDGLTMVAGTMASSFRGA